jgi:hypothetical protein
VSPRSLWIATVTASLLSLAVYCLAPVAAAAPVVAPIQSLHPACGSLPGISGFAWAQSGPLICMTGGAR